MNSKNWESCWFTFPPFR